MPRLNASVRVVTLSVILSGLLSTVATASPATDLFEQVSVLVNVNYGGLSTVDRPALLAQTKTRLDAACADQVDSCPVSVAYAVLRDAMTQMNDLHTYLNTPEEAAQLQTISSGGSRLQFGFTSSALPDGTRVVTDVLEGSPAETAGLARGDHLVSLNGHPYDHGELAKLREAGARIELGLARDGQELTVSMQAQETSSRNLPRLKWVGSTAVIRIPTFTSGGGIAQRVHDLVHEAETKEAQGIVVDLRDNPGGNLFECDLAVTPFVGHVERDLAGTDGTHTMSAEGDRWLMDGKQGAGVNNPQHWDGPLAVLVNQHSASCSEFFALAVQGAHRGPVIGEETSGAGNTSTVAYKLLGGGELHLTRSHFAYPDGQPYPSRVEPDQQGSDNLEELAKGDDCLLTLGLQAVQTQTHAALNGTRTASAGGAH